MRFWRVQFLPERWAFTWESLISSSPFPKSLMEFLAAPIVHYVYEDNAIYAIFLAGIFLLLAAVASLYVQDATAISMKQKR
jgi:hypothetical protein